MAKKLYEESSVQAIADAIRAKNGSSSKYKIANMASAINNIDTGFPNGTKWTRSNITKSTDGLLYANGLFIAASSSNYSIPEGFGLCYSENGKIWTQSNVTTGYGNKLFYLNNLYFANLSCKSGTLKNILYYSENGKEWTQSNITSTSICLSNVISNTVNYVVASNDLGFCYSENGKEWTQSNFNDTSTFNYFCAMKVVNNIFLVMLLYHHQIILL